MTMRGPHHTRPTTRPVLTTSQAPVPTATVVMQQPGAPVVITQHPPARQVQAHPHAHIHPHRAGIQKPHHHHPYHPAGRTIHRGSTFIPAFRAGVGLPAPTTTVTSRFIPAPGAAVPAVPVIPVAQPVPVVAAVPPHVNPNAAQGSITTTTTTVVTQTSHTPARPNFR